MLNNVDKTYHDLLQDILDNGYEKKDSTGTGTISVFGRQIRFNMKDGFTLLTTKKLHIRSIIHELLWFISANTNVKYLNDNGVTIWDEWCDTNGDLGPVYGKQWVDWGGTYETVLTMEKDENGHHKFVKKHHPGINQIQRLIDRLNTAPDCRRMIVSAWNVGELDQMALMPCHYGFQVWTRELSSVERSLLLDEKLGQTKEERLLPYLSEMFETHNIPKREITLMMNQRSVDTGLGLPFNIASYALLLHMIAQQVNMVPGELIMNLGDTHIYTNHIAPIKEQLKRNSKTMELPKLVLNKAKNIFSYKYKDFKIEGYDAHPSIKMDISV